MDGERALWANIIIRAAIDAHSRPPSEYAPDYPSRFAQWRAVSSSARAWFEANGEDYRTVCGNAGFDPDFVRDAFMEGRLAELHKKLKE